MAQAVCDAPKYLECARIEAFSTDEAFEVSLPLGNIEGVAVYLWVRWSPVGEELSAALTAETRHVRRLDTAEHQGKQPHIHYFDGTREMHTDVRALPEDWSAGHDFAKLLRRFADSVNLTISEIGFFLDSAPYFTSNI
jgi:hypothetical protein